MSDSPDREPIAVPTLPDPTQGPPAAEQSGQPPASTERGGASRHSGRSRGSRHGGSRHGSSRHRDTREQAEPLPAYRPAKSRHISESQRKLSRLRVLAGLLGLALIGAAVTGIFGLAQLQRFRGEANELASRVRQLEADLTSARERLAEMATDMRVLLANRIPGIAQIGFGRALEVNEGYLRNLTFLRGADDQRIEYSMVLENVGAQPVVPRVRILLFDEAGLQSGVAVFEPGAGAAPLVPGESRTYSGPVQLERAVPPVYFLAEVE